MQMSTPINLAVFSAPLGSGGAERHTVRVLNELPIDRYRITVLCPARRGEFEDDLRSEIAVHHLGSSQILRRSATLGRLSAWFGLRRQLTSDPPDLLLSVQDAQNAIALSVNRSLRHPVRQILVVQNSIKDAYPSRWSPGQVWIRHSIRTQYQEAAYTVALSQGVGHALCEWNPRIRERLSVIYNAGIDDHLLESCRKARGNQTLVPKVPVIIAAGRLSRQKGYPYLLDALAQLRDEGLHFEQWILGVGPLESQLREQVARLQLTDKVRFLGFNKDPFQFMAQASVFVLPSLYEGFGNVIVEAMACGVPVVASDCPHGPAEIITPEVNGLLVPPANANSLASALRRLLVDAELSHRLAVAGEVRARDFHARTISGQYDRLITKALGLAPA
jgi:glycosyltransferase involved in cell wall biosynthesis